MKNKIKNILKYISLAIVGAFIFIFGLTAQAETYFENILLNNIQNAKTYCTDNTIYTYTQLSYIEINHINMLDSGYGYERANNNKDVEYIIFNANQNITINTNNTIIIQDFGLDFTFEFQLNQNTIFTIETLENGINNYSTNQEITFNKIKISSNGFSFEEDSPLFAITSNTNSTYYQQGYNEGQAQIQPIIDELNQQLLTLRGNYNNLLQQYNELANQEYTFENLFWSVGSVPMAFLMQSFNVNVLGLNMAAIITGLITALVVIWAIKKLLK